MGDIRVWEGMEPTPLWPRLAAWGYARCGLTDPWLSWTQHWHNAGSTSTTLTQHCTSSGRVPVRLPVRPSRLTGVARSGPQIRVRLSPDHLGVSSPSPPAPPLVTGAGSTTAWGGGVARAAPPHPDSHEPSPLTSCKMCLPICHILRLHVLPQITLRSRDPSSPGRYLFALNASFTFWKEHVQIVFKII